MHGKSCAKYVLDDRVKATYLAALGGGELRGRRVIRPSLLAVVGPIRQQATPCWETSAAWCSWTSRRSVMAIRPWQPAESMR